MKYLIASAVLILSVSCSDHTGSVSSSDSASVSDSSGLSTGSSWKDLTESWNASLNLRNASIMKSFYADSVVYYGDHLSSDDVVHRQQEYFRINQDYSQKIEEYIDEIQQPDGSWLIKIMKRVSVNGKVSNYPASLVFANQNGIWKIVAESDDITDLNKAQTLQVKYGPEKVSIDGLIEINTTYNTDVAGTDPKSEPKITYYALWCKHPLDVIASAEQQKAGIQTVNNVERVQVIGDEEQIRKLLNRNVRITGTLEYQSKEGHFTPVAIKAELIEEVL